MAIDTLEQMQAIVDRSPFNRWIGVKVAHLGPDGLMLEVPWRLDLVSSPERNSIHGGVLASLIDTAGDYAIAARLGYPVPTIDLSVDYHRAASSGILRASAQVVHMGKQLITAQTRIADDQGRPIASGRGLYFDSGPPRAVAKTTGAGQQ